MARRKTSVAGAGREGEAGRFPPRWLVLGLGVLLGAGMILAVAGDKAGAVVGTFIYWVFVLPVAGAGGMLGLLITEPFARRGIFEQSPWPAGLRLVTAVALGLGAFALATLLLGAGHLVEPGGNTWPLLAVPLAGAVAGWGATRRFFGVGGAGRDARVTGWDRGLLRAKAHRGEWLLILAAVPVAALLMAASYPPGSLWATEARGYDVMEYHLEMPREYALNNSTAPVGHNVYSYLPANVEMLYLLQMQMAKGMMGGERDTGYLWGTFPAQYLHVLLMLLAAAAVGLCPVGHGARKGKPAGGQAGAGAYLPVEDSGPAWLGATGRAVAVLLFLGVPWTLVTGSLAYNEGGMLLFGILALGLALDGGTPGDRRARGVLIGLLLGLAVGCKMTAGVFFALPVAAIFLVRAAMDGGQLKALLAAVLVAGAVYLPWAARAAVYSTGNPVFPIAATVLPRDGWTAEQAQRWAAGHAAKKALQTPVARLWMLGQKSALDAQWSVQPYPMLAALTGAEVPPAEALAWWQRIGLLWLAVPLALGGAFITRVGRGEAGLLVLALVVQVAAWMWLTQLEARFLLPAAVPLALLAGRGVQGSAAGREAIPVAGLRVLAGTLVALHACLVMLALLPESGLLSGAMARRGAAAAAPPIGDVFGQVLNMAAAVEHPEGGVAVMPEKVLLIGDARAWMYVGEVDYFTTFDSHPLAAALGEPARALAWLRSQRVRYVVINWSEVERLRRTYGFDAAVTREAMAGLEKAGAVDVHVQNAGGLQVLRVE